MSRPSDDDREEVDRAFADLVASYYLTSDRPDPLLDQPTSLESGSPDQTVHEVTARDQQAETAPTTTEEGSPDSSWADNHPLFRFEDPVVEEEPELDEQFVPEPPMPLPHPAWPALVAWIAMGYSLLVVLAISLGAKLPTWVGWLALIGFVGGFGLLMTRLPRHRPPDAGNGAVL